MRAMALEQSPTRLDRSLLQIPLFAAISDGKVGSTPVRAGGRPFPAIALAALIALAAPVAALANSSVYTDLDFGKCRAEPPDPDDPLQSGVWWCEGYRGIPVRVAEGDLRHMVSYGSKAADEPAASQTIGPFNYSGAKIEWRLDSAGRPVATILRFHTDSDGRKGSTLVVTKLGPPGQVCQVGTVNAVANPDANQIARDIADNTAPGFVCGKDTVMEFGLSGDEVPEHD
jgi:hypothetical protein